MSQAFSEEATWRDIRRRRRNRLLGKRFLAPGGTARAKALGWVYAWNVPENARGQVAGGESKRGKWPGMMLERLVAVRSYRDWWPECHW